MAYTPELDQMSSVLLRRLAWAENRPMTSTLKSILWYAALDAEAPKVCAACRDRSKCSLCAFEIDRSKSKGQLELVELLFEV